MLLIELTPLDVAVVLLVGMSLTLMLLAVIAVARVVRLVAFSRCSRIAFSFLALFCREVMGQGPMCT